MKDISGQRFGRLKVLKRQGVRAGQALWLCACDCGQQKLIVGYTLRRGLSASCGCLQRERTSSVKRTHGKRHSRVYNIWASMMQRCGNPSNPRYASYGGRGIRVCERWENFENFYKDMGDPPKWGTLERRDNDGIYAPSNCCWASRAAQSINKRNSIFIEMGGKKLCVSEWSRQLGISRRTITARFRRGLSPAACLAPVVRVVIEKGRKRK